MTFGLRYGELPSYLRISYIFAQLLILCHIALLGILIYWQTMEPENLTYKAWLKVPMHLSFFENMSTAAIVFGLIVVAQLICLFLYTSWIFEQGKKIYYITLGMLLIGLWSYFMLPALILLCLMLPEASLHHFGILNFEDLF